MRKIKSEEIHRMVYKSTRKYRPYRNIFKIKKVSTRCKTHPEQYALKVPREIVETFKLNETYYSFEILDSGNKIIYKSGCLVM